MHPLLPIPPDIEDILSAFSFLKRQRSYNGTFAMPALGASPSPTWTQPSYPSMLKLHGKPYHRVMDSFRETSGGTVANNQARMYIYDKEIQTHAKRLQLDADTLTYLSNRINRKINGSNNTILFSLKSTKANTTTFVYRSRKLFVSRPPLALKLRLYHTKTTNAHLPKDTSTQFPAAVQLTNVKSHGSCRSGRFCMNLFNFHFSFISASQVGAQDGIVTTGNPAHSLPLENQFRLFNAVGNGSFASPLSELCQHYVRNMPVTLMLGKMTLFFLIAISNFQRNVSPHPTQSTRLPQRLRSENAFQPAFMAPQQTAK